MLRSILIRQTFVWVDLSLAVLFIGTAGLVIYTLLQPASLPQSDLMAELELDDSAPALMLPKIDVRSGYDALISSGLFGDAGKNEAPAPPPPVEEPTGPVEETKLNLHLIGTTSLAEKRFASAVIQEGDAATGAAMYVVGEKIMDKVTLLEVGDREVYILNETGGEGKRERLSMDDKEDGAIGLAAAPPAEAAPATESPTGGVQRITLNRDELMTDIMTNYTDIATKLKPELARDENGNVIGVTANNINQIPMARKLGLGDGDILQTVNNEQIDSEQKIYEMIQKYQNAASIRIGVMSGGKPKVITYRLN